MLKIIYQCLLLSLLCAVCSARPTGADSAPVHLSGSECQVLGRALLRSVMDALSVDKLFRGLNCTEQSAELRASTRTLSTCTPENLLCLESNDFTFDQDECLQSVLEDLHYYWAILKSYHDPEQILEQSVLRSLENLIQSCFSATLLDAAEAQISMDNENSFERRLNLCKVLKGFQVRTVTINRVLNHVVSTSQK